MLNTNPNGHGCTSICTVSLENCKLMRVLFTSNVSTASSITMFCGILHCSTFNFTTSFLLGGDSIVYMRSVQLTFTSCVYCSAGSLLLLLDTMLLCTVDGTVPNLCPTCSNCRYCYCLSRICCQSVLGDTAVWEGPRGAHAHTSSIGRYE